MERNWQTCWVFYFVNTIRKSVQYCTFNCVQTVWIFLLTKATFWTCCSCSVEYWEWNALTWVHLLANVCVLILCFLCSIGLCCLFFPSDASAEWAKWYCNSFLSTLCVIPAGHGTIIIIIQMLSWTWHITKEFKFQEIHYMILKFSVSQWASTLYLPNI